MQPLQQRLQLAVRAVATILRIIVDELGKCIQPEALRRSAFVAKSFKLELPLPIGAGEAGLLSKRPHVSSRQEALACSVQRIEHGL